MQTPPTPSIKDRIRLLMDDAEMNQKDFAIITGITAPTLSSIFNGRTQATLNHVMALHKEFPNVSMQWLLFGEGEMYSTGTSESSPQQSDSTPTAPAIPDSLFPPTSPAEDSIAATTVSAPPSTSASAAFPNGTLELTFEQIEEVKKISKPQRRISEIHILYDDGTYEVFGPK